MNLKAAVQLVGIVPLALLLLGSAESDDAPQYFEVITKGYSRFEIEDGNVIASYPEEVEFTYLGYKVHADSLRFNQATMLAEAQGQITLYSEAATISCEAISLDGKAGKVALTGGILGDSEKFGLAFRAAEAYLHFPPDEYRPTVEELSLELAGGINLADKSGNRVQAEACSVQGSSMQLAVPGTVRAELQLQLKGELSAQLDETSQTLQLECSNLRAVLNKDTGLENLAVESLRAVSSALELSTPSAQVIRLSQAPSPAAAQWRFDAVEGPVLLHVRGRDQELSASSASASVTLSSAGLVEAQLAGGFKAWSSNVQMEGDSLSVQPSQSGFVTRASNGVSINVDIAQISGRSPIDLKAKLCSSRYER